MKRKYLLLLTVCCSCLLAAFICSGCNNRDSSQKHTDVKNHTSAKETVKPYSDFKYADHFNRSNLSLTDRSMDSIDIDTFKSTFNEFHTALDSDGNEERILSLYDQLCEQLNMLLTDATLAQYAYYLDKLVDILAQPAKEYNLSSPIVCHGYGSVISIQKYAFLESQDERCLVNLERNVEITLKEHRKKMQDEGYRKDFSLLNGSAGTILALCNSMTGNLTYGKLLFMD